MRDAEARACFCKLSWLLCPRDRLCRIAEQLPLFSKLRQELWAILEA
jgi:hypothetical protein